MPREIDTTFKQEKAKQEKDYLLEIKYILNVEALEYQDELNSIISTNAIDERITEIGKGK